MSIAPAPTASPPNSPLAAPETRVWNPFAAVLSYLVPGLGQISQGRVSKGMLFFVCIYALFFYGSALGSGVSTRGEQEYRISSPVYLPDTSKLNNPLGLSPVFADLYNRPQFLAQFWVGIAAWPAVWQYTHYDDKEPIFGSYHRSPDASTNNAVNTDIGQLLDLGWVLTVIAGVLNILVIYDALACPAFLAPLAPVPKAT
jgi:hypothetical protein